MEKVGQSEPCPCGSGLEYKRCHGSVVDPKKSPGNMPLDATTMTVPIGGFPAQHQQMHQIFRFNGDDPRNNLPVEGAPGSYEVVFVLRRPGYPLLPERQISFSTGHLGDSHLAISKPAFKPPGNEDADQIRLYAGTEDGRFEFVGTPNSRGFLGKLTSLPFKANSRLHAEEIAYRALAGSLSNLSLQLDIPLEIAQTETKERLTHNVHISFVSPHIEAPLAVNPATTLMTEYRGIASLYREAMNTNSPVFQFLCFYKIIEALRARRKRLERQAKKAGTAYVAPTEVLPTSHADIRVWLNALFYARPEWDLFALDSAVPAELRGKTISSVVEDVLGPIRVDVAHALFRGTKNELNISADELLHTQRITKVLPLTKCIVRRMLKNDFPSEFLNHLPG